MMTGCLGRAWWVLELHGVTAWVFWCYMYKASKSNNATNMTARTGCRGHPEDPGTWTSRSTDLKSNKSVLNTQNLFKFIFALFI